MSEKIIDKLRNRTKKAILGMNVDELISLTGFEKAGLILHELQKERQEKKAAKAKKRP